MEAKPFESTGLPRGQCQQASHSGCSVSAVYHARGPENEPDISADTTCPMSGGLARQSARHSQARERCSHR